MRLIDADGLIQSLTINPIECPGCPEPEWLEQMSDVLDSAETVDAVPVVRCRDCAHWNSVMKESEFGLCNAWVTLFICTGSDEYCKRGKKKEA